MPTAGKAAGAVLFGILAFVVARMIAPSLPAAIPAVAGTQLAAAFGVLAGWHVAGGVPSGGIGWSAARGVTAACVAALWTLLCGGLWLMLQRAVAGLYEGPVEALSAVVALVARLAAPLLAPLPLAVLFGGGALAGVVTGAVARRLP